MPYCVHCIYHSIKADEINEGEENPEPMSDMYQNNEPRVSVIL